MLSTVTLFKLEVDLSWHFLKKVDEYHSFIPSILQKFCFSIFYLIDQNVMLIGPVEFISRQHNFHYQTMQKSSSNVLNDCLTNKTKIVFKVIRMLCHIALLLLNYVIFLIWPYSIYIACLVVSSRSNLCAN